VQQAEATYNQAACFGLATTNFFISTLLSPNLAMTKIPGDDTVAWIKKNVSFKNFSTTFLYHTLEQALSFRQTTNLSNYSILFIYFIKWVIIPMPSLYH